MNEVISKQKKISLQINYIQNNIEKGIYIELFGVVLIILNPKGSERSDDKDEVRGYSIKQYN